MARFGSTSSRVSDIDDDFVEIDFAEVALACSYMASQSESDITRAHWKHATTATSCGDCGKKFNLLVKRHWCYCCGHIFCITCGTNWQRKLNLRAEPDPVHGRYYTVCGQCYRKDREVQSMGFTTELTAQFAKRRNEMKAQRNGEMRKAAANLVDAYLRHANSSSIMNSLRATAGLEDWSRVNVLTTSAKQPCCGYCEKPFGLLIRRHMCRLCGYAFCDQCLFSSVELFRSDNNSVKVSVLHEELSHKQVAVLKACEPCLMQLEKASQLQRQVSQHRTRTLSESTSDMSQHSSERFAVVFQIYNEKLAPMKRKAETDMEDYVSSVHSLQDVQSKHNLIQTIVKHQVDLTDLFSNLQAETLRVGNLLKYKHSEFQATEKKIIKNLVQAYHRFCQNNIGLFRRCRNDVQYILPDDVAKTIQDEVDTMALRFCLIVLNQIAIESLAFSESLAAAFLPALESIREEWAAVISSSSRNEDPEKEYALIQQLVAQEGRENPMLIKGTSWQTQLVQRWNDVFQRVFDVLNERASKQCSERSRKSVKQLYDTGIRIVTSQDVDWVILNS